MYAAAGLVLDSDELPDHLPVMLAFAALAPPGYGEHVLQEHRIGVELLLLGLRAAGARMPTCSRPFSALPRLGLSQSGGPTQLAEGPPDEQVGLEPFAPPEVMPVEVRRVRRSPAPMGRASVRRDRHLPRRPRVALPHRPVRLDDPLDADPREPVAEVGQPALPPRSAGGDRRPRARHPRSGSWTSAVGVSEHSYHLLSAAAGTLAGVACGAGLVILIWRRIASTGSV